MCTNAQRFLCENNDCAACFNRSFASSEKAQFWSELNQENPRNLTLNSSKKFWFNCPCGHIIQKVLHNINQGSWCPFCSNPPRMLCESSDCIVCFNKSFASHPKNTYWGVENSKSPRQVFLNDNSKYWFECLDCFHMNYMALNAINGSNANCAYCSNQKICDTYDCLYCFEKSFASSPKSKYWSDENAKLPRMVAIRDNHKYIFNCECGHEFTASPNSIASGCFCPYDGKKLLCDKSDCTMCFNNSFASSEKVIYWSKRNDKNPREVFKSSGSKYWFNCSCGHEFDALLYKITSGNWCPYCSQPPKLLCNSDQCITCFNNSFASHEKSIYWSDRNLFTPRKIFKCSGSKYWFDCECGHEFDITPDHITSSEWCPYCSTSPKLLCDNIFCQTCFDKSFASSEKSEYWSNKNELCPRQVFLNSKTKYWFNCDEGHEFETDPGHINNNRWCPYCKNKTETKLYLFLKHIYPDVIAQVRFEWCKNQCHLPFDIIIPSLNFIIELDGSQHFKQISNWASPEDTQKTDIYKINKAIEHGYTIIHILQEYVANDKNQWQQMISNAIELHVNSNTIIFINETNEYKDHYKELPGSLMDNVSDYIT